MARTHSNDDPDYQRERQSWLRGNLPSWLIALLIFIVGFGGKVTVDSYLSNMTKMLDQIARHEVRISVIENATGIHAELPKQPMFGQNK
jgi:hypothetical protein